MASPSSRKIAVRAVLLAGLSVAVLTAGAAIADTVSQPEAEGADVVITGRGYRVQKDALMSHIDIISREQIDQKPASGLGDALAYLPGVRSSGFAPGASRPIIRGLEGFRVLVLNNGMGVVDVSALSPDHAVGAEPLEARRIEVLRGPSALAYGGNAIGGIVNVIDDRIPATAPADGLEGRVVAQLSSVDNGKLLGVSAQTGQGPLVFSFDLTRRKSDDYDTPVGPESRRLTDLEGEDPDTGKVQLNAAVNVEKYGAGVSWIGDFGFVGLGATQTDMTYGVPGHSHDGEDAHEGGEHSEDAVTIGLRQTRFDIRSRFDLDVAGFNRLTADAGHSDYAHTEFEGEEVGTRFLSNGGEYRLAFVRDGLGNISGTAGVAGFSRAFQAIGEEAFVPSTDTKQIGMFAQYRYDNGTWGVEGGGRIDKTELRSADLDRDFDTTALSLGAFYRPSDHSFGGLSLTRSERAPSDVELLADGPHGGTGQYVVGDSRFATEVGYSFELTGHIVVDSHNAFAIDAHIYASHFDNFIDLAAAGEEADGLPVFRYVQGDADIHGLEIEASTRLFQWRGQIVELSAGYDYVYGQTDNGPVARIPPQALTLKLQSDGERWKSYAEVRAVDARDDRLTTFELPTDGYTLVNLFTSYKVTPAVVVFAEVRNLDDAEIREATSPTKDLVVGPGRNLRLGLTWSF